MIPPLWSSPVPWALLAALFAAFTSLLAKVGLEGINSDLATWIRTLVVALVLGILLLLSGQLSPWPELPRRGLIFLALSGLATGASWLCFFRALQRGPVALVAPLDKLSVVLVALLGVTLLGEELNGRQWLAIGLMGAGGLLLALPGKG